MTEVIDWRERRNSAKGTLKDQPPTDVPSPTVKRLQNLPKPTRYGHLTAVHPE